MKVPSKYVIDAGAVLGIVGAGTMGAGIAQVAAAAGHRVMLFDVRPEAAAHAVQTLAAGLQRRVATGKLTDAAALSLLRRIEPVTDLGFFAEAAIVIEVIVEQLQAKRELMQRLEGIVSENAILASNTSSISITALGRDLNRPQRLVGMHFFNPVPAMKLVEVVSGTATDLRVAQAVAELAERWGKTAIHTRSTPGFVVNRIARPFYAEALLLLQDHFAKPATTDAALRGAGFRMGPCELMDLIGHDVNYAVTESMYAANYFDKRFGPSLVQRELIDAGMLGKKSSRGFYDYGTPGEADELDDETNRALMSEPRMITVYGDGPPVRLIADALKSAGWQIEQSRGVVSPLSPRPGCTPVTDALVIGDTLVCVTDGRPAAQLAAELGRQHVAVVDLIPDNASGPLCVAFCSDCGAEQRISVLEMLRIAGRTLLEIGDAPGLIVARTVAMIINEAADAVLQHVCDERAADTAMKLGVNYPRGPFEWLALLGAALICTMLENLDRLYRGERYRISLLLRSRVWAQAKELPND